MEPAEQLRRRSSNLNPNALVFNPRAAEFQQSESSTSSAAQGNAEPVPFISVTMATTAADSLLKQAESSRRTLSNVTLPTCQPPPLQSLLPSSSMAEHSWANELEHHAMNLGLPMGPSQSHYLARTAQDEGTGGPSLGARLSSASAIDQFQARSTSTGTPTRVREKADILPPHDARDLGLDGKLVQQALIKSLTPQELERLLHGNTFIRTGHDSPPITTAGPSGTNQMATPSRFGTHDQGVRRPPPGLQPPPRLQPPPGLGMPQRQHPHMNMGLYNLPGLTGPELQQFNSQTASRPMMDIYGPVYPTPQTGPSIFSQHTRVPSLDQSSSVGSRSRRQSTRGGFFGQKKRSDQGPEPSNADIYPEDAAMAPGLHGGTYESSHAAPVVATRPQPPPTLPAAANLRVEDATAWPTPAEAKANKPTARASASSAVASSTRPTPSSDVRGQESAPAVRTSISSTLPPSIEFPLSSSVYGQENTPTARTSAPSTLPPLMQYPSPSTICGHANTPTSRTSITSGVPTSVQFPPTSNIYGLENTPTPRASIPSAVARPTRTPPSYNIYGHENTPTRATIPSAATPGPFMQFTSPFNIPGLGQHPAETRPETPPAPEANIASTSPTTVINQAGSANLLSDQRSLTPGQEDGSRYGLRFYGIGYSDAWDAPPATQGQHQRTVEAPAMSQGSGGSWDTPMSFRIRPRDHPGWGGWNWAAQTQWFDEE
ncbi:hypothetical protein K458DRAFT_402390 [Lentithecium fluviatile CBS 122367]|uniref:Uncharacterized protein n=1 Tax=Lentithecium fluviatile CBS 122367 TaxID=1168545 RepID=A0A6G1J8G2_9PLEO|nr:hypothetical protein K458DRAFT_402390 [Lentithecium fluviatile CBS 122367]